MNSLKISKNYTSLKTQYLESQMRKFPVMGGGSALLMNDMDSVDAVHNDQTSPIEVRDSKIKVLEESLAKAKESAQFKDQQIASLEEQLKEDPKNSNEAEVKRLILELSTAQRKVNKICDGSANRLLCAITNDKTPTTEPVYNFLTLAHLALI